MNGFDVVKKLRQTRKTPVLMLTARGRINDRITGLDAGADDYLPKPFDLNELFARLRALIRRSAGDASNVIDVKGVIIDVAARTVKQNGALVDLTAREYSLVEHLVLRRGKLVTRTELYDHLFDENDTSLSNLLDVHVSNLRKKLGHDFITTRRGHGYCIEA
jgi:two-component system OmpR family response regulator